MGDQTQRRPGRPRSDAARTAILAATALLVAQDGYTSTTIDGIAARAGVGKQTIYRWWPTKADVVLEATSPDGQFAVPVPDLGTYTADLRAFLRQAFQRASQPQTADLLRSLMAEAQQRPEFGERFRATFVLPRQRAFAALLERAKQRGDLPPHPTPAVVTDVVFGTLWYRLLTSPGPLDRTLVEELVATLC